MLLWWRKNTIKEATLLRFDLAPSWDAQGHLVCPARVVAQIHGRIVVVPIPHEGMANAEAIMRRVREFLTSNRLLSDG